MALPVINDKPKYELKVPSTKKSVRFRPFLVKEQKVLLLAYESKDKRSIVRAMLDTIQSCCDDTIDVYKLSTFDVDYIFTQIRAKSVGESVELTVACSSCSTKNDVSINLENIAIDVPKQDMVLKLTDSISIKFKYPDYGSFLGSDTFFTTESRVEQVTDILISCLDSVMTEDENISIKDEPREEIIRFIDSLSSAQFDKVNKFIDSIPTLKHDINFKCISCGTDNLRTLEGLEDFF